MKALLVCLVVLLPLPASAAGSRPPVILVLGDSLSAAHGIPLASGWVSLLRAHLKRDGYHYRVVNASVSGDTTRGGRERLPPLLRRYHPAVVIVELGGNDGLRGLSLHAMRFNLAAIIRASRKGGARVLLLGMRLPPNYGSTYTHRFHQVYPDLARRMSVPLVPFLLVRLEKGSDLDPALMQEDGIHPNARGQPLILAAVLPKLVPLLQQGPADGRRATTGREAG